MDASFLRLLPDELLEAIVFHLPAEATLAFGSTCKRGNKIAYEHLIWRNHCVHDWRYWEDRHELQEKLQRPPAQTKWRQLYNERRKADAKALAAFDEMLTTQQYRIERMEEISKQGYDVKDTLLRLRDETPEDAEDVLARRYYADAVLGQLHRKTALEKWTRLQQRQMVRLEEVLCAYDLFVLGGRRGDLTDVDHEFDRIAQAIRAREPVEQDFDSLSIRVKATRIAEYLWSENLVGNPSPDDYHALRNNFISIALFDEVHTSLPLQSVAIYCAVARRLGLNAKPSNYPGHVHAVIEAPNAMTLDGRLRTTAQGTEPETMHMDPWRSSEEVPQEALSLRLVQMGAPPAQHGASLGATSTAEMVMRTGRNIMHSVQEARDRQRVSRQGLPFPDIEAAWYSMLWSMIIIGDQNQASTLHRRRQCLPYLAEHFQAHFPEDLGLVQTTLLPMFENEREHHVLLHLINTNRTADQNKKAPKRRAAMDHNIEFKVGMHFQHKRYGYEGFVIGWDFKCSADPRWMHQMRVDDLPRGREQPFYNVV